MMKPKRKSEKVTLILLLLCCCCTLLSLVEKLVRAAWCCSQACVSTTEETNIDYLMLKQDHTNLIQKLVA